MQAVPSTLESMKQYATGSVSSADGTTIGYRRIGQGPAVVLVHGGLQAAQSLMRLATALAGEFDVVVPDRRGRGSSGPYGERDAVDQEVEDLRAVVSATGASRIFGLSSGALLALRTVAMSTASMNTPPMNTAPMKAALYEPPLSVNGSVPTGWISRYDRHIASGKRTAALVTVLKGLEIDPAMQRVPDAVLRVMLGTLARKARARGDDVPLTELVPTMRYDIQIVQRMADSAAEYSHVAAEALLLGGSKSPGYLAAALDELQRYLPDSKRVTFPGLGHTAASDDGDPDRVAAELSTFFRE